MKRCPKCGATKPRSEFFKNAGRYDGVSGYCRPCQQTVNGQRHRDQRRAVIELLGGPVCVGCGVTDERVLTIDHKNGGGSQHRRDAVSLWRVYAHALKNPDAYQVLCWNCNYLKRLDQGEVPSRAYRQKVLGDA